MTAPGGPPIAPAPSPPSTPDPRRTPADGHRTLKKIGLGVGGLAALLGALAQARDGAAQALGGAVGTVVLIAIVSWPFRRFASPKAGWIAAVVAGAVASVAGLAQVGERAQTNSEIHAAIEDLDLADDDFEPDAAERACLEASGFDEDDLLTALTDTGTAGSARQRELIDVMAACAPRWFTTDDSVEQFRRGFSAVTRGDIDTAEARCFLAAAAETPTPSEILIGVDLEGFRAIAEECFEPESLALLDAEPGTGPQAIGDDPDLDRLADWCTDGSDLACDLLYESASLGSDYFVLAQGCGEREPKSEFYCAAGMTDDDATGFIDTTAPGWTEVVARCEDGEMVACDFAFATAEIASEHERVGETCGGRRALSNGSFCFEAFGEIADE